MRFLAGIVQVLSVFCLVVTAWFLLNPTEKGGGIFIALGFAAGVFVSCTPFLGFHLIMASLVAWIVGGSIVAAVLGTFIGNPITYPIFWFITYEVGSLMLGRGAGIRFPILGGGT